MPAHPAANGKSNGNHNTGWFDQLAKGSAWLSGRPGTFLLSGALILAWLISGPFFGFSDTWQLVINTGTTIVTFLMVFLIQNTQNRDTAAIHLKLDELIRAVEGARNSTLDLEDASEEELREAHQQYARLAAKAHQQLDERGAEPLTSEDTERSVARPSSAT